MKNIKTILYVLVTVSLIFYLAGVVIAASFSIPSWDKHTREILSAFWLLVVIVAIGITAMREVMKDE